MWIALVVAVAALATIVFYNRGSHPTSSWVGRAQQLASVVLVLTGAVESLVTALDHPNGHEPPLSTRGFGSTGHLGWGEETWR